MSTDDELLTEYKKHKNSTRLVIQYRPLLNKLAHLSKGTYRIRDPIFDWFYGLFLDGEEKTGSRILDARDHVIQTTAWLSHEDCYAQVVCFFLEIAERYKKCGSNFHQYVRMVLPWKVKNWITVLAKKQVEEFPQVEEIEYPEEVEPFKLDLDWVVGSSLNPLFKGLQAYDRYLLYLYFVEGFPVRRVAHHTYQSKNTVNNDLESVLRKCRENIKE